MSKRPSDDLSPAPDKTFFFDAVRGLSAQMVLVGHALNVCFASYFMQPGRGGMLEARPGLFYIQNLGVVVFFCISGYLVTASVLRRVRRGGYGFGDYLLDRFARIFTPLLPLLAMLFVLDNVLARWGLALRFTQLNSDPLTLLLNATMLFDHAGMSALARVTGIDGLRAGAFGTADQLWTVVIEWWIYVSFGVLSFAVLPRQWPSAGRCALLLFALLVPCYWLWRGNGLIAAWIVGMLGAAFHERLLSFGRVPIAASALVLGAVAVTCAVSTSFAFYHPVFAVAFSASLLAVHLWLSGKPTPARTDVLSRLLKGLSDVSYSVYLVHLSVLFWLVAWKPDATESVGMFMVLLLAANAASVAFYFAFERHYPAVRRALARLKAMPRVVRREPA